MTRDEVLDKVRKLYALAGSTTEGEARAALQAADTLVQKYRIEQAELGVRSAATLDLDAVERGSASMWRLIILGALCARYGVRAVRYTAYGVFLCGTDDDKAIVRALYERVSLQVQAMTMAHAKGRGRLYADSFRTGIAETVFRMLDKPEAPQGDGSTALAVLDNRGEQAQAVLNATPGLSLTKFEPPEKLINIEAYENGKAKGKHVHLGEELAGAQKGALPVGPKPLPRDE